MNKQDRMIGVASIEFDEFGKISNIKFESKIGLEIKDFSTEQLSEILCSDKERVKTGAEVLLASWFSKVTEIELADQNEVIIDSEISNIKYHEDGAVKSVEIIYKQKSLKTKLIKL